MAITLFDPQLVIARLQSQVAGFKTVSGSADIDAADKGLVPAPAAFVLALTDQPSRNEVATFVAQRNVTRFGVAIAVQNLRDPRGEKAGADLRILRMAVIEAMLNWSPGAGYDPCEFAGGRLLQLSDQVLWWQDEFLTALYFKAE